MELTHSTQWLREAVMLKKIETTSGENALRLNFSDSRPEVIQEGIRQPGGHVGEV